ncbi:hypothetical protein TrRE_jg9395 [Triparma retinervis]|uniref:Transmembrane protein n=1 Tax=Triparma retinervis TaxID=2557542 RepID=A0A9W7E0M7_9STRA|nr:hypothetical protein TrRE_jg9395 [Triparma retinervis]
MGSVHDLESVMCALICPVLLEGRTHALIAGREQGRKLIIFNSLLILTSLLLFISPIPFIPRLVTQILSLLTLLLYCWMRRIRRRAILEAWDEKSPTTHNYTPLPILRTLHEYLTHNLLSPLVPRDDAVLNTEGGSTAVEQPERERKRGMCKICFFNPFGACALAQESRHVEDKTSTPTQNHLLDFFTHEPLSRFQKRHWFVRRNNYRSLIYHLSALSQCSRVLIMVLGLTVVASVLANKGRRMKAVLACFVLMQPVAMIWAIQWRTRRFDVSLDSVVKLFMTGFFISSPISLISETTLHSYLNYIFTHFEEGPMTHLVAMFLFSFLVASLVEETTKYYGVVMTRLPVPFPENEIHKISKRRRAAACTTYFTCLALGFSTAENLLLTVTRHADDSAKLVTLCMRFVMPIHVLTSAIMSVFVVQEDIEKPDFVGLHNGGQGRGERREGEDEEENITFCSHIKGTWRKIRPSFLLHGTFDFVLFGLGYFIDGRKPHSDVELVEESEGAQLSPFDNLSIVVGFCSGVVIMCMGLFYYVSIASQQDRRLKQEEFPLLGRLGDERGRGDSIDEDILEMTERAV